jgi:hypothetical protein
MSRTSSDTKELLITLRYVGGIGEIVIIQNNKRLGETGMISAVDARERFSNLTEMIIRQVVDE